MSKLKTLKDLKLERADTRINDILRAEAVEWVKNFGNEYNNVSRDILKYEFIKFFNLTESDLEEKK